MAQKTGSLWEWNFALPKRFIVTAEPGKMWLYIHLQSHVQSFLYKFRYRYFVWRKRDKQKKNQRNFIHECYIFSQKCNEMFKIGRIGAKIRVGRETGNRYNFVWPQCYTRIYMQSLLTDTFKWIQQSDLCYHFLSSFFLHSAKVLIGHLKYSKFWLKYKRFGSKTCFILWSNILDNICQNINLIKVFTKFQSRSSFFKVTIVRSSKQE